MKKEYKILSWWADTKFFLEFVMYGCGQVIMPIILAGMVLFLSGYFIQLGLNAAASMS